MRIAIVGSGISGLTCAHHLQRVADISVFEAEPYVGGHSNTVDVDHHGKTIPIDTGFIVYNEKTYPLFSKLLDELNVQTQKTEMSFSLRDQSSGFEYCGSSLNGLFAQRTNILRPSFYFFLLEILRFNRMALRQKNILDESQTVSEFLIENQFSKTFADRYLYPMGSAIWSCPIGDFSRFPIRFIVGFYDNHGLLNLKNRPQWRVIRGGSKNYVCKLIQPFQDRVRTFCPVHRVIRGDDQVFVSSRFHSLEPFDHVIFACHSEQALRILADQANPTERQLLSKFPYSKNQATLHTDERLLPRNQRAWASWNYLSGNQQNGAACVTYNMNILQSLDLPTTYCVTLNGESLVAPEKIIRRFNYEHPVFTTERKQAQSQHNLLIDQQSISFCGAYWGNGFHEDGVASATRVVDRLQNKLSQKKEVLLGSQQDPQHALVAANKIVGDQC